MARSLYLIELKDRIQSQLSDVSTEMLSACLDMIDYVAIAPSRKKHLTFIDLYKHVDQSTSEDIFYKAVFFLTKNNVNVLTQKFEAFNSTINRYEAIVDNEDIEELLDSIATGEYIHPINGSTLTAEQFGEQVLTYFSVSNDFVSNVHAR